MLGDFSCRVLSNILGYLWPAYSAFKAVESQEERMIERWCIYWLILAIFTTAERLVLDWTIFWIPLFYEGKLAFVVWLWHPHTQGAQYIYRSVLCPVLAKYEPVIDDTVAESRTWLLDNFWHYVQRATKALQANAFVAIGHLQNMRASQAPGRPPRNRAPSADLQERGNADLKRGSHSRSTSAYGSPERHRSQAAAMRSPSPSRDSKNL